MGIDQVGPWLLLIIGIGMLGAGAVATYRDKAPKRPWIYLFGLACAGCGVWGPSFLEYYAKLAPIFNMQQSPDAETYSEVFAKIGDGTLSPKYQELAVAYALDRPIEGMDSLLDNAIEAAPNADGKAVLHQAQEELRGKKFAAEALADAIVEPSPDTDAERSTRLNEIAKFDTGTRRLVAKPLLDRAPSRMPEDEKVRLRTFAAPRDPRTKRNRP